MHSNDLVISTEGLSRSFGEVHALKALDSPIMLTFSPAPDQINPLSVSFMTGQPVFSWLPLIATVVSCIAFVGVAIWRFNRQEF